MPPANVDQITEAEIPEVAGFLARQVPRGEPKTAAPLPPAERLRWLLLENPARAADIPFGWRIRDQGGTIVGSAICSPFRVNSGGVSLTALMFSKFYVDLPFRGLGLGLLMRFVREGRRFPLFCTSTNAIVGAMFARLAALQINGLDHTMLGIRRPGPLIEEWLHRRLHSPHAARLLAAPARFAPGRLGVASRGNQPRGELTPIANVTGLDSLELPVPPDLTAVARDRAYLAWRYFSGERGKDVYRYQHPHEPDRLIVINRVAAGHRGQIRVLNVLDAWPPTSASSAPALCERLSLRYQNRFDTIWLRSQPPASEEALTRAGFRRHMFPAPLGWYIDRESKLPGKNWYVMPGESE